MVGVHLQKSRGVVNALIEKERGGRVRLAAAGWYRKKAIGIHVDRQHPLPHVPVQSARVDDGTWRA